MASLHPVAMEAHEDLLVLKSKLSGKLMLFGTSSDIDVKPIHFTEDVSAMRQGIITVEQSVAAIMFTDEDLTKKQACMAEAHLMSAKDFMEAEQLGTEPPKRCTSCRGCQTCTYPGWQMSEKETMEFTKAENGVVYEPTVKKFRIRYPYIEDPSVLKDNVR